MSRRSLFLYGMLVLLSVLWGTAFVGIKEVLAEASPVTLTVLRFAVSDVCLIALLLLWRPARFRFPREDWARIAILAVTGVPGYHLTLNWGEERTSASTAALVVAIAPVLVAVLSAIVLRERIPRSRAAGIALAFAGVAVIALRTTGDDAGASTLAGFLVALGAPVSWAVYTIVAKPLVARHSPLRVTVASLLAGTLALIPLSGPGTWREAAALSAPAWAWIVWLGAGASVAGYLIFVWALERMSAARLGAFIYAVPVVALVSSWIVLDEPLGPAVGVAAVLVVGGVALSQRDPHRAPASRTASETTSETSS